MRGFQPALFVALLFVVGGCEESLTWPDPGSDPDPDPGSCEPVDAVAPFYAGGSIHSPINAYTQSRLLDLYFDAPPEIQDDVFMKVGASSTESTDNLACFVTEEVQVDAAPELWDVLQYFMKGNAAGGSPFERESLAAQSGRTAAWVIEGSPSPLEQELDALQPRYAFVHYGANDMEMGISPATALGNFYRSMVQLVEQLEGEGVIPVLIGITHRADSPEDELWVPSYNAVIRGIAQTRALPFIDLWAATDGLDGWGLGSDGLHLNSYEGGACVLSKEGLGFGFNVRNRVQMEALARLQDLLIERNDAPEACMEGITGTGLPLEEVRIHSLPFAHGANTAESGEFNIDVYDGCDSDADESGPELLYELVLEEPTAIRALVLDSGDVDVDIHLLDDSATGDGCIERAHQRIERTLEAGTYYFSVDSWVGADNQVHSGDYLFVVLECTEGDSDCQ